MISGKTPLAKAIRYALARMPKARPYLDNGFLELDNNTAERAVRPVTLGRKNCLFMGSEAGGKSAAIAYSQLAISILIIITQSAHEANVGSDPTLTNAADYPNVC